ncbi:hypothetical protein QM012_003411 [Aureobasidium pullulans]|uniref:Uncharacterized protein n=1 Tax=Aureobasidium pullulans TaxID=5580 RepID=A0ABR0T9L5_AURPU
MPKNRKPCPASNPDCLDTSRSSIIMAPSKTAPQEPAKLVSEQAPKTFSEEEIGRLV